MVVQLDWHSCIHQPCRRKTQFHHRSDVKLTPADQSQNRICPALLLSYKRWADKWIQQFFYNCRNQHSFINSKFETATKLLFRNFTGSVAKRRFDKMRNKLFTFHNKFRNLPLRILPKTLLSCFSNKDQQVEMIFIQIKQHYYYQNLPFVQWLLVTAATFCPPCFPPAYLVYR